MLLHDSAILEQIRQGRVTITPFDPALVQPASVDVRLGSQFRVIQSHASAWVSSRHDDVKTDLHEVGGAQPYILHPGGFVLGTTVEKITLPGDVAARIEGKSTLGRLGLLLHSTAGWIDPGFSGQVTLELSNVGPLPVLLFPGDPIGQVCLFQCAGPAARPYGSPGLGSRYQGQVGPTASRPPPHGAIWPGANPELMAG